jgi:hypothetical protein
MTEDPEHRLQHPTPYPAPLLPETAPGGPGAGFHEHGARLCRRATADPRSCTMAGHRSHLVGSSPALVASSSGKAVRVGFHEHGRDRPNAAFYGT